MNIIYLVMFSILISCSVANKSYVYSRDQLNKNEAIKLYEKVPVIQTELANNLVCAPIECYDQAVYETGYTSYKGTIYAQVLVDKNGDVEAIYFSESVNSKLDSMAVNLIRKSTFYPLRSKTEYDQKYSVVFAIAISEGTIVGNPYLVFQDDLQWKILNRQVPKNYKRANLKKKVLPEYPIAAQRAGVEGLVISQVRIGKKGEIKKIYIISSASPILDDAVKAAISKYEFTPSYKDDKPIESWWIIPIQFKLDDSFKRLLNPNQSKNKGKDT